MLLILNKSPPTNPRTVNFLARVAGIPVSWCFGGRLAARLVATILEIIFLSFSSVVYFSHRKSARILF